MIEPLRKVLNLTYFHLAESYLHSGLITESLLAFFFFLSTGVKL